MLNVGEGLPTRRPFAQDNGAYLYWKRGLPYCVEAFLRQLDLIQGLSPDFVVLPDVVAGGLASLELSLSWIEKIAGIGPLYLALQDGMSEADILPHLDKVQGLFVGGSDAFKLSTGASWCRFGQEHNRPVHIGRAGTKTKTAWALRSGATSVDSCFPLWRKQNMTWFLQVLSEVQQDLAIGKESILNKEKVPRKNPFEVKPRKLNGTQGEFNL
jgi:hypothetical protein